MRELEREAFLPSAPALEFIGWNAVNIQNAFPSKSFHNCCGTRGARGGEGWMQRLLPIFSCHLKVFLPFRKN